MMKKTKKLTLNKQTVSKLNGTNELKGGAIWITFTWTATTTDTIGGGGTDAACGTANYSPCIRCSERTCYTQCGDVCSGGCPN